MIKNAVLLFSYSNVFVFAGFLLHYDAIQRPNAIGYFALVVSVLAGLLHYWVYRQKFQETGWFGFMFCICLIAIGHNFNYLLAADYKGQTEILHASRGGNNAESWRLQLANGRTIDLRVYDLPSDDAFKLRLRRGIFGVYFGAWVRG
jgi:hypothetical protein